MLHDSGNGKKGRWSGWLLMAACCVPMVAVAILVAVGYWSFR